MDIQEKIIGIVAESAGENPKKLTVETCFREDLGFDSLDAIEAVMMIEEEFGIEIPDDAAEKFQTIGDVVKYVKEQLNG